MKLRIITGRHGVGKTHKVYSEIGHAVNSGHSSQILIVPELFTHTAEQEIMKQLKLQGILSLQVLSPSRMQERIFDETGGRTLTRLDNQGRCMIIRKCINEHASEMGIYTHIYESHAFAEELLAAISNFKQCDITPEQLEAALKNADSDTLLKSKLEVLYTVYKSYEDYMSGNYIDEESSIALIIEKLPSSKLIRSSDIWIDGFDRFNSLNLRLIKALAENAKSLTVTMTVCSETDDDSIAYLAQAQSVIALKKISDELGCPFEAVSLSGNPHKSAELTHLERSLYARRVSTYKSKCSSIHVYKAVSQAEEIEYTALMIRKLAHSGIKYSQIAVVCNNLETLSPLIARTFSKCDIPYFIDAKRPISLHPVIVMLKSAFDIIENGYRSEDIFRYVKTGFVTDAGNAAISRFENYCRENGVMGARFRSQLARGTEEEILEFEPLRQEITENLVLLHQELRASKNAVQMAKAMERFIECNRIEDRISAMEDRLKALSYTDDTFIYRETVEETAQILSGIYSALDSLINLMGETHLSMRGFFSIMRAAFDSFDIGIIPTSQEQVIVGDLKRTETPDIKIMFILAANAEYFPVNSAFDGFINQKELEALNKAGIKLEPDLRLMRALERFDMHSAVSKPTNELFVCFSESDIEKKALHISGIVTRIMQLFPSLAVEASDEELCLYAKPIACDRLLAQLKAEHDGKPLSAFWQGVYNELLKDNEYQRRIEMFEKALVCDNAPHMLSKSIVNRLYRGRVSSASQLENYAACPYRFYIDYGLRPSPRREYSILKTDSGVIYHEAISKYVELLIELGSIAEGMTREESDAKAENIFNGVCERFRQGMLKDNAQLNAMTARMLAVFKSTAWAVLEQVRSSRFKPAATEISFGMGGTFPPIMINTPEGESLQIRGKIDRIDRYRDENGVHISIIDYKSGDKKINIADIVNGTELQLMLYMGAVIDNLPEKDTHPAGAFYMRIHNPIVKGSSDIEGSWLKAFRRKGLMSSNGAIENTETKKFVQGSSICEEDFRRLIDIALKNASDISSKALNGFIPIEPLRDSVRACAFCEYKSICRFNKAYSGNRERIAEEAVLSTDSDFTKGGEA